jgi:hypothetical protein
LNAAQLRASTADNGLTLPQVTESNTSEEKHAHILEEATAPRYSQDLDKLTLRMPAMEARYQNTQECGELPWREASERTDVRHARGGQRAISITETQITAIQSKRNEGCHALAPHMPSRLCDSQNMRMFRVNPSIRTFSSTSTHRYVPVFPKACTSTLVGKLLRSMHGMRSAQLRLET